jgi:hypothetical protein
MRIAARHELLAVAEKWVCILGLETDGRRTRDLVGFRKISSQTPGWEGGSEYQSLGDSFAGLKGYSDPLVRCRKPRVGRILGQK